MAFESNFGCFRVESDEQEEGILNLSFNTVDNKHLKLGQYCSTTDAILAVVQQQTGCADWDQLTAEELPRAVHNIASWNFYRNVGTFPRLACS